MQFLTSREAAKMLQVDVWTIDSWVRKGLLTKVKLEKAKETDKDIYKLNEQDVLIFFAKWQRPLAGRKRAKDDV